MYVYTHTHITR